MHLEPGSLWQHRKHDPEASEYHQYRVIRETLPADDRNGPSLPKGESQRILHAKHTETLRFLWIHCGKSGCWAYCPATKSWLMEPLVVYRSLAIDELPWARPKGEFVDGRFTSIQSSEIDEPTISLELFE